MQNLIKLCNTDKPETKIRIDAQTQRRKCILQTQATKRQK